MQFSSDNNSMQAKQFYKQIYCYSTRCLALWSWNHGLTHENGIKWRAACHLIFTVNILTIYVISIQFYMLNATISPS